MTDDKSDLVKDTRAAGRGCLVDVDAAPPPREDSKAPPAHAKANTEAAAIDQFLARGGRITKVPDAKRKPRGSWHGGNWWK